MSAEEIVALIVLAVVFAPVVAMWLGIAVSLYRDMVKPTPPITVQRRAREK